MGDYGAARLADLYKEHRHQCKNIDQLIEAFSGGQTKFTTPELLEVIQDRLVKEIGLPEIDGNDGVQDTLGVAHFLFRIGFISARDEAQLPLGFVIFEDRPNLLTSALNPDDGLLWEIHPSYRQVLRIARRKRRG